MARRRRGPEPANLSEMTPPEWARWEQLCKEATDTEDMIRYAALAIGKWPNKPPHWAVEACRRYYEAHERAAPGYQSNPDDLDAMADLIVSGVAKTKHDAARQVTRKDTGHADIRRLLRLWDNEIKLSARDSVDSQPVHLRLERAAVRLAKRQGRHPPWDESLTPTPPTTSKKRP